MGHEVCSLKLSFCTTTLVCTKPIINSASCRICSISNELGPKWNPSRGLKPITQLDSSGVLVPMIKEYGHCLNYSKMSCSQVKASIGHGQIKTKEIRYGFYEVIDQLEHMAREPADILDELQKDLSTRDLQLVLVYFSQEGKDSWCVLEVFDWMRKVDRVDDETMDLMLSIMSSWLAKLVEEERSVEEVQILLTEMKCVGLVLNYDMVETLISLYLDRGKRLEASRFVKYLLEFGGAVVEDEKDQDPTSYLMWKMSKGGGYREVVNLIFDLRNCGLKPKIDSYLTALMAVVMEQNQFTRAVHELEVFQRNGKVGELEKGEIEAFDSYQRDLHKEGEQIAKWAMDENMPEIMGQIHERLAAMYMVAVRSAKAEHHLWQMKHAGQEPTTEMYDAVLAVCAVEKNLQAVGRIMAGMEVAGKIPGKKTFSWLVRGYVKGGHFEEAAKALMDMLKKGLHPDNLETMVVLKGLQKNHLQNGYTELYLNLCKSLYTADCKGAQDIFRIKWLHFWRCLNHWENDFI